MKLRAKYLDSIFLQPLSRLKSWPFQCDNHSGIDWGRGTVESFTNGFPKLNVPIFEAPESIIKNNSGYFYLYLYSAKLDV